VRVYAYDEIEKALDDLSSGGCDAFMKLAPVTAWFVRDWPKLKVVETGITVERLGICVRKGNTALRDAIGKAQATLAADGTLPALIKEWLGAGARAPAWGCAPCCLQRRWTGYGLIGFDGIKTGL
jgi:polar amino acid transport system substrate-binding protein